MENSLAKSELFQLTQNEIDTYRKFEELKAIVKEFEQERKEALLEYFRSNPANAAYEDDNVVITYRKPTERRSADVDKMKRDGIFEEYSKTSPVSDSVTIKVKYNG